MLTIASARTGRLAGSEMPETKEAIVGKARAWLGREARYTGRPAPAAETKEVAQARPELPRSKASNSAGRLARPRWCRASGAANRNTDGKNPGERARRTEPKAARDP